MGKGKLGDPDIRPALLRMIVVETWFGRFKETPPPSLPAPIPDEQLLRVLYAMYDEGELPGAGCRGIFTF